MNLGEIRNTQDWEELIRPYLKERHSETASRLAEAARKGDMNTLQLESGRLLEIEELLGLESLLRAVPAQEETNGRRERRESGFGRRFNRLIGRS